MCVTGGCSRPISLCSFYISTITMHMAFFCFITSSAPQTSHSLCISNSFYRAFGRISYSLPILNSMLIVLHFICTICETLKTNSLCVLALKPIISAALSLPRLWNLCREERGWRGGWRGSWRRPGKEGKRRKRAN